MSDQNTFIKYINDNYQLLKNKYRKFCSEKQYSWDEDVFSDTILKCHDAIKRKGKLEDKTAQGIENYFFRSFKQNIQREKQYCRVSKRDLNITSDNINNIYEDWYNKFNDSSINKIKSDLYKDFSVLYIMHKVEEEFDGEHFYLFKLKSLMPDMTYKKLQAKTHCTSCRQKVVDVKNWVKQNISKKEITDAFQRIYGNLL
jgi:hypothetical protein